MTIKYTEEQKKEIRQLYQEGMTNAELVKRFGIGKSSISYIVDPTQKEKTNLRMKKNRTTFKRMLNEFVHRPEKIIQEVNEYHREERKFYFLLRSFFKDKQVNTKGVNMGEIEKIGREVLWPHDGKDKNGNEYPYVSCAITGKLGSVMAENRSPERISLDHKIAKSNGGINNLKTNMQPLLQSVNEMKRDYLESDFFTIIKWIADGPKYKEWEEKLNGTGG